MSAWWKKAFPEDPVLDQLICEAYHQNLTLREAGFRILQARATLGIAVGELFPQSQYAFGSGNRNAFSTAVIGSVLAKQRFYNQWNYGFGLAWEFDFWGRFRRGIESSSAALDASVADYDDVLVTLLSDVATNYVNMRTFEKRIEYARINVEFQKRTLKVVDGRKIVGVARQLDVDQAKSILYQTEAGIPELEIGMRQASDQLCVLLGITPEDLQAKLRKAPIPKTSKSVAIGIPADLLRRRPDIRRAERQAAAQCAQIGIAEAQFYPAISLVGTFSYTAARFGEMFSGNAFGGSVGPSFQWDILNYGRILNNVRLQDAKFQELTAAYQQQVLVAQQEVEDGLVQYVKAQQRAELQGESVRYSDSAVKTVVNQFEAGTIGIAQLILILQNKVVLEDTLAQAQGEIALGLILTYKALGGGWQIRNTDCAQTSSVLDAQVGARLPDPRPVGTTSERAAPRPRGTATLGPPS